MKKSNGDSYLHYVLTNIKLRSLKPIISKHSTSRGFITSKLRCYKIFLLPQGGLFQFQKRWPTYQFWRRWWRIQSALPWVHCLPSDWPQLSSDSLVRSSPAQTDLDLLADHMRGRLSAENVPRYSPKCQPENKITVKETNKGSRSSAFKERQWELYLKTWL